MTHDIQRPKFMKYSSGHHHIELLVRIKLHIRNVCNYGKLLLLLLM